MGKKKRLNRLIARWIKSDLPDDHSTVLLLGVTRIPTTPTAARRPCSLPLGTSPSLNPFPQNNPIAQHKSRKSSFSSRKGSLVRRNSLGSRRNSSAARRNNSEQNCVVAGSSNAQNSKSRHVAFSSENSSTDVSSPDLDSADSSDKRCSATGSGDITPSNVNSSDFTPGPMMDRSVDSIGACSLDADASVDITDWSEQSSVGTLRSVSLPTPEPQPHLPSYLSLACTVSGYSTTTNYDPERLARSRDASPHRLYDDLNPHNRNTPVYSIRNNLLSPPNVVPLPHQKFTPNITPDTPKSSQSMEEQLVTRHEFYSSSTRSTSFMSKESRSFVSSMFASDSVDGCVENGHQNGIHSKCVSFETKNASYITNGSGRTLSESAYKEFANGVEKKSFIQQRVERLYGPGALAQGFFISKRQKNRSSESESQKHSSKISIEQDKHSKSFTGNPLESSSGESNLKQSTSSPTLPVLRHLRPEFRAQLPIISPKKCNDSALPKSVTIPTLKEETKTNGHSRSSEGDVMQLNGNQIVITKEDLKDDTAVKDGHYFLNILERQTERLLELAENVEKDLASDTLPEEIKGKLRSAAGKARLLASQKMQQFKGLCTNNITQREGDAFPTTNEDLQGFWDMVLLQVDQVDTLFKDIDQLRANGWQEVELCDTTDKPKSNGNTAKPRKIANRTKPSTSVNEEARKEREAKRKQMIEERRRAMREQKQKPQESIEIFVPESS